MQIKVLVSVLAIALFFLWVTPASALLRFEDTDCSGTFICKRSTTVCNPLNCNPNLPGCTCETTTTESTGNCTSDSQHVCTIQNTNCNAGTDYSGCTFTAASAGPQCGDGSCNGTETSASCPSDCGSPGPACGNGSCETGETCSNCSDDCGACPPGGGCSGTCWALNNCGERGDVPASGNCPPGEVCCKPNQGPEGCQCCSDSAWTAAHTAAGSCQSDAEWTAGWYAGNAQECAHCQSCTPSCTVQCGQADTCGGSCSNSDDGAPSCPTLTPSSGGSVTITGGGEVTVSWTAAPKAERYNLQIYPRNTNCSSPYAVCVNNLTTRSYTFTPNINSGYAWTMRVRPINLTCDTDVGSWCPSYFTINARINAHFYLDNNGEANYNGSMCSLAGANDANLISGNLNVEGRGGPYTTAVSGATGSILARWWPSGNYEATLDPGVNGADKEYQCTCPDDCRYTGISAPQNGVKFYVTTRDLSRASWWQVRSGLVYGARTTNRALVSAIPITTCEANANCTPNMIRVDSADSVDSAGIALTGGGAIDSSEDTGNQTGYITERNPQLFVRGTTTSQVRENYAYFYREYSMGDNPSEDFANPDNATLPTANPTNGRAYFHNGNMTIKQAWTISANQQVVVFVNGNLTFEDPDSIGFHLTQVAPGGFLAFIVSGNITIDETVGNENINSGTTNLAGVFVADGSITVQGNTSATGGEKRFVGGGTFVGWNGIRLERDYGTTGDPIGAANNAIRPTELFFYRPDLVQNAPERFKRPQYIWQETN